MPYCPTCKGSFSNGQYCPSDGARLVPDDQAGAEAPVRDDLIGQVIGDRFQVVSRLGQGGMGTVYEAQHRYIAKRVALKLLRAEITEKPEALARFQREALAASTIGHENIVTIDDFGRLPDGQVYLTMEYLDGQPLNRVLAGGQLPVDHVLEVAIQTCHGLAAAHAKGIIHRDMKPENIFLVDEGRKVKILDFGIAKVSRTDNNTNLTKTGAIFGTPNYMAPEQALGKAVDHRADLYAMGVILYEMLTGHVPFRSDSFLAILTQHVTKEPEPPTQAAPKRGITPELEALVLRAMAKNPDDRFADMGEMVAALLEVRRQVVGDRPLASHLRLSKILPPTSEAPTTNELPPPIMVPEQADQGKVTATAGELVEAVKPPRKRTGMVIGLAAAALLLVGGTVLGVMYLGPGATGEREDTPVKAAATVDGPPAAVQPAPPGEPAEPGPEPVPEPEAKPGKSHLVLKSRPEGATILVDGKKVGMTPDVLELSTGVKAWIVVTKPGYHPGELEITPEADQGKLDRLVRLRRIRRRRGHAARRARTRPAARRHTTPRSDHGDHGSSHDSDGRGDHSSSHGDHR
jgi:serine/threonine-protein kinase